MPVTRESIVNRSGALLREMPPIHDINENTPLARLARQHLSPIIATLMSDGEPWTFASGRVKLNLLPTAEVPGWAYVYNTPNSSATITRAFSAARPGSSVRYETLFDHQHNCVVICSDVPDLCADIVTSEEEHFLQYAPATLVEYVVLSLAWYMADPIVGGPAAKAIKDATRYDAQTALSEARELDELKRNLAPEEDSLVSARR